MKETTFHLREHLLFALLTVLTLILCIGVGSVSVPFRDTAEIIFRAIAGWEQPSGSAVAIILYTRLPRVLCVALVGAMLALGGCAMQGLLRNPLADGSTLGVSSGASLGAALAILSGVSIPFLPFGGTAGAGVLSPVFSPLLPPPPACGRSPSGPGPSVASRHLPTPWGVTLAEGAKG